MQNSNPHQQRPRGQGNATGDNVDRDYIMMDDLLQDMADDGGGDGDGGEPAGVMVAKDV